jgi:hypothetical protein
MSVSLRDFFAAHAAAAMVNRAERPVNIARRAYDIAEALMAERQYRDELEWLATPPESLRPATHQSGTDMGRPWDARATEKVSASHLLDEPTPLEEEEPLPSAPGSPRVTWVDDLDSDELALLAAGAENDRDEILAMIASEGYVAAWDPSWDDRGDMTDWDRDARWERALGAAPPKKRTSDRPGLARTVPEQMELRLEDPERAKRTGSS